MNIFDMYGMAMGPGQGHPGFDPSNVAGAGVMGGPPVPQFPEQPASSSGYGDMSAFASSGMTPPAIPGAMTTLANLANVAGQPERGMPNIADSSQRMFSGAAPQIPDAMQRIAGIMAMLGG